ncbi:hypothetical protein [Rhizobium rhizogenes]|uniref:hypothetical protein n=1 Tax=Rhizobium rhizogenes TaxID=359 RepID=UPI0015741A89|nr:hypothetical protein [Rhizobium rhizogenes]NTF42566.1 hypothetical protein [Rhizobium rhizogenes]
MHDYLPACTAGGDDRLSLVLRLPAFDVFAGSIGAVSVLRGIGGILPSISIAVACPVSLTSCKAVRLARAHSFQCQSALLGNCQETRLMSTYFMFTEVRRDIKDVLRPYEVIFPMPIKNWRGTAA